MDLTGEVLTEDTIGYLMFAINLQMALYFVYDVWEDVGDHAAELLSLTQSNANCVNPMLEPDVQKSES